MIRVEVVPRRVVRPLQLAVLRPGQQMTDADLVDEPGAFYVASYDSSGGVAGVAAFLPEAHPDHPGADHWRLRGMASEPSLRGSGYAAAALRRGIDEVAARGGVLVWCNARTPAVPFYEAHGFSREGSEFVIDPIGPHYRMSIRVGPG